MTTTKTNMKRITKVAVLNYWVREISKYPQDYIECEEFNTTKMGEDAAEYFGVMSDDGQSAIERDIFDWAVDFCTNHVASEF